MANDYYTHTSFPAPGAAGASATMRAELDLVTTGFDKLPTLAGNASKVPRINSTGTALEPSGFIDTGVFSTIPGGVRNPSTTVDATNALTTVTQGYVGAYLANRVILTGTAGASLLVTLIAGSLSDGFEFSLTSTVNRASVTWNSVGNSFVGAPSSLVANVPVKMQYIRSTLTWYIVG